MDDRKTLTETERLLLMAAAVHDLGPDTDLAYANTARVVDQALRWRGLSVEEIRNGWREPESHPINEEVYNVLIRMTHQVLFGDNYLSPLATIIFPHLEPPPYASVCLNRLAASAR